MRNLRQLFLSLIAALGRPLVRRAVPVRRIVYLKPDHLGDVLLATPVLAELRAVFPTAQISALVGPWSRVVLAGNPHVDALLVCPYPGFERAGQQPTVGKNSLYGWFRLFVRRLAAPARPYSTLLRYAALLRVGRYDLAIVGRDDHWWGAALALLAGIPRRVGFAVPECRPFLTDALPWNPSEHVTVQGLALVAASADTQRHGEGAQQPTRFYPPAADSAWAAEWQTMHMAHEQFVVIHPGTGGPTKHWHDVRWAAVANALADVGVQVVLTGGPGEEARVARVAVGMRTRPLLLAGKTTVGQLAALMGRAALVLGVDSGPLHLAAAMGVPTVHLYGPGDDARFGPWGDPIHHVVLHSDIWCRPCGVFSACPRGLAQPACMEQIAVASVIAAARQALGLHAAHSH